MASHRRKLALQCYCKCSFENVCAFPAEMSPRVLLSSLILCSVISSLCSPASAGEKVRPWRLQWWVLLFSILCHRQKILYTVVYSPWLVQTGSGIFASVQDSKMAPGPFHLLVGRRSWSWPRSSHTLPLNDDQAPLGVVPYPVWSIDVNILIKQQKKKKKNYWSTLNETDCSITTQILLRGPPNSKVFV